MARPVRVRPLSEDEDRQLLRIVRGAGHEDAVRFRRALIVRASARGIDAPVIADVLDADTDHIRDVIHAFNANGLAALDPRWGPGPPAPTTPAQQAYIVQVEAEGDALAAQIGVASRPSAMSQNRHRPSRDIMPGSCTALAAIDDR